MVQTIIHFVRHGIVNNTKSIFYGRLSGYGLNAEGYYQARHVAQYFIEKPIAKIFTSPLLRARQTASGIARLLGNTPISISSYLSETRSPYDGFPLTVLDSRNWDIYSGTSAPYEQPLDVFKRTHRFIDRTTAAYPGQQVIAVTHADVIVFLSLWAHGYELKFENKLLIEQMKIDIPFPAPASVSTFTWLYGNPLPVIDYSDNQQEG